eukprot:12779144-Ditylum_brightwellii.AAC.1
MTEDHPVTRPQHYSPNLQWMGKHGPGWQHRGQQQKLGPLQPPPRVVRARRERGLSRWRMMTGQRKRGQWREVEMGREPM